MSSVEQDGGQSTGDDEYCWQTGPGLSWSHLHFIGVNNDPVSVQGNSHHCQRRHEHRHTGECLDKLAEHDVVRQVPGHVEAVHHSPGHGECYQQVRYGQVKHEDIAGSTISFSPGIIFNFI